MQIRILILLCFGFSFSMSAAWIPPLEREVNFNLHNDPVALALTKIQEQTNVVFSYPSSIISALSPVTATIRRKTVREVLAMLLPATITYKTKNNYIILKERTEDLAAKKARISGYVYDQQTQDKVPNATIYDQNSMQSATTNDYGYYSIVVPASTKSLNVNRESYRDTTVQVTAVNESLVNFSIQPQSFVGRLKDSLFWRHTMSEVNALSKKAFSRVSGFVTAFNISDTLSRRFQVSFLPFIGTNHKLSGSVYNQISVNVLGGYAGGLNGFEAGGLFNVERENVQGVQVAGLFNIVGDSLKGTHVAGLFNITGRDAKGLQLAGLMNINESSQKGLQAAGLMNFSKTSQGASLAGLMNISERSEGTQLAGLANMQDTVNGLTIGGLYNAAGHAEGATQLSGLFNHADGGSCRLQLAGLFNSAKHVKGLQLAPLNFADTVSGLSLGLLSFVKKGVHQLEFSGDEIFYSNISFRTGTNAFYNILSVGVQPGASASLWQLGYGAGTSLKLKERWRGDLSVSVHHVSKGGFYWAASEIYRAYLGLEFRPLRKFSIALGPTFNLYITDTLLPQYESTYMNVVPFSISSDTDSYAFNRKMFFGARLALRFF